jgi:hemerythrin-like domain-containing protein
MDPKTITKKALFEHDMLAQIIKALHVVLEWRSEGEDISRKLSSVKFIGQSLHWHLERLMKLESDEHYLDALAEANPGLPRAEKQASLVAEHEEYRAAIDRLIPSIERLTAADRAEFDKCCAELFDLLMKLESHSRKEVLLLPEIVLEDESVIS